ncbi:MMPL family transporter [Streptomyces sp. NPDC093544]|uniref:MMPL family transporter n=1 Tax=Streptomyces sp. NPDC093544 TaxID=3155200 RepID=UPI0034213A3A
MNLLSVAASYGVVALVLQGGWAGQLVGIDTETPLPPFVTVLMFAVLFGLSMDFEVFLVSRMRESWIRTCDNTRAVTDGLAGTGRVITAAVAIMIAVFVAFVPSPDVVLRLIGVGMAAAISSTRRSSGCCWSRQRCTYSGGSTGGSRAGSTAGCPNCTSRATRSTTPSTAPTRHRYRRDRADDASAGAVAV